MMTLHWRAVEILAQFLSNDEREAVLGDIAEDYLAEDQGTAHHHLSDMLGLIIRRQLSLWASPRPWIVLLTVVLPAALVLQRLCSKVQGTLDLYSWILRNRADLDPAYLSRIGLSIAPGLVHVAGLGGATVLEAFVFGFLIARLSRRTVALEALLFVASLLVLEAAFLHLHARYEYAISHWPFPLVFYTLILPSLQVLLLAFLPALFGIRQGLRTQQLHGIVHVVLWTGALVALFSFPWRWSAHGPLLVVLSLKILLFAAAIWPVAFLLAFQNRRIRPLLSFSRT